MDTRLTEDKPFADVPLLITEWAARNPKTLAVTSGSRSLSYGELERSASHFARHLINHGVKEGDIVAVHLNRSESFIVAALAVLKTGAAYLPLDPAYPVERLRFILDNSSTRTVISDKNLPPLLYGQGLTRILIGDLHSWTGDSQPLLVTPDPDRLAYVIYTSGSTGQPKGVEVSHASLINLIQWHQTEFGITDSDRASQVSSVGFDAAVWEIWPYLTAGASLHIVDDLTRNHPEHLRHWLEANGITATFVATPMAEQLIHLDWGSSCSLRVLLTGGDKLHRSPSRPLPFALYNNYGPTEATVVSTSGRVTFNGAEPSIGRPILNVEIHILDGKMRPVSPGAVGELFIGGAGVARGYVNNPALTASRFLPAPFSTRPGARMYRTGDLAFERPDGEIGFCGRIDEQIKVRGFRVEPNEVIAGLNQHPAVRASAVCAHEDPSGEKTLAAYLILRDTKGVSATQLREFLREHLPDYMVPSLFISIDRLPVTPNGKVDLHALPLPDPSNVIRDDFVEASTAIEQQLLEILQPLLGIGEISLNDNFFLLGGHSLLGAQLLTKVRETFGVELTLINLFENPTVAAMAAEIERLTSTKKTLVVSR